MKKTRQVWVPKKESSTKKSYETKFDILSTLPFEIAYNILQLLSEKELLNLSVVSKSYKNMSEQLFYYLFQDCKWKLGQISVHPSWKLKYYYGLSCESNWKKRSSKKISSIFSKKDRYYLPKVRLTDDKLFCSFGTSLQTWKYQTATGSHYNRLVSPKSVAMPHKEDVTDVQVVGDSILTSSTDATAKLWSLSHKDTVTFLGHQSTVQSVDMNDEVVVTGSFDRTIKLWNRASGNCTSTISVSDRVWSVKCDSTRAVAGTSDSSRNTLTCIDLASGSVSTIPGHAGAVYDVQINGSRMITAGYDSAVRLWDLRLKNPCTHTWDDPDDYASYCVKNDWNWKVVSGTAYHGTLRIWDERMGKCIQTLFVDLARRSQGTVYSVDFDDSVMYVALSNGVQMIDFL